MDGDQIKNIVRRRPSIERGALMGLKILPECRSDNSALLRGLSIIMLVRAGSAFTSWR